MLAKQSFCFLEKDDKEPQAFTEIIINKNKNKLTSQQF